MSPFDFAVFSAAIIRIGLTEAVAATILGRAINLLIIFILGPIFSCILLKHKPTKMTEKFKYKAILIIIWRQK